MPLYQLKCLACNHEQDEFRAIDSRNDPGVCEDCGAESKRIVSYQVGIFVAGSDSDNARRHRAEDDKISRLSSRARNLKKNGMIPNDSPIPLNDPRIQD